MPHFEVEEELLFPKALEIEEAAAVVRTLLSEHAQIRELLAELPHADEQKLPESLKAFGEILERHIRLEERELFPILESAIAQGKLSLDELVILHRNKAYRS